MPPQRSVLKLRIKLVTQVVSDLDIFGLLPASDYSFSLLIKNAHNSYLHNLRYWKYYNVYTVSAQITNVMTPEA